MERRFLAENEKLGSCYYCGDDAEMKRHISLSFSLFVCDSAQCKAKSVAHKRRLSAPQVNVSPSTERAPSKPGFASFSQTTVAAAAAAPHAQEIETGSISQLSKSSAKRRDHEIAQSNLARIGAETLARPRRCSEGGPALSKTKDRRGFDTTRKEVKPINAEEESNRDVEQVKYLSLLLYNGNSGGDGSSSGEDRGSALGVAKRGSLQVKKHVSVTSKKNAGDAPFAQQNDSNSNFAPREVLGSCEFCGRDARARKSVSPGVTLLVCEGLECGNALMQQKTGRTTVPIARRHPPASVLTLFGSMSRVESTSLPLPPTVASLRESSGKEGLLLNLVHSETKRKVSLSSSKNTLFKESLDEADENCSQNGSYSEDTDGCEGFRQQSINTILQIKEKEEEETERIQSPENGIKKVTAWRACDIQDNLSDSIVVSLKKSLNS